MKKETLSADLIKAYLGKGYAGDVYFQDKLGSTNDEAKRLVPLGAPHGTVVAADMQSCGRGRRGNSFHSPSGTGIYMSIILKPCENMGDVLYTVAAAVAVRRVLDRYTECKAEIKWVNDIYISERKVCGILCEQVADKATGKSCAVVCGIGVNLTAPKDAFPDEIKNKAGYVCNIEVSRAKVISEIAKELLQVLELDHSELIFEYSSNMMLYMRNIFYRENGELKEARAIGVDMSGGLVVSDSENNCKTLRSGEVHLEKF